MATCECGVGRSLGPQGTCIMCGNRPPGPRISQSQRLAQRQGRSPAPVAAIPQQAQEALDSELATKLSQEMVPFMEQLTKMWLVNGDEGRLLYFDPDTVQMGISNGKLVVTFQGRPCQSELEEFGLKSMMAAKE